VPAVTLLPADDSGEAVAVLCDAFHDYPVMRYVLGSQSGYDARLRILIDFFANARVLRSEPLLGIHDEAGTLAGVALITPPGERPEPEGLSARREAVWRQLGAAERARYEGLGQAWQRFDIEAPHHHLNMIGVRRSHAGLGLGRRLLDAVHHLSQRDPSSCGVTLSTETSTNVPLYQHFGYRILGHARITDELETWTFFRERR
jgi:GNAT superfamily N-acetyltransferase